MPQACSEGKVQWEDVSLALRAVKIADNLRAALASPAKFLEKEDIAIEQEATMHCLLAKDLDAQRYNAYMHGLCKQSTCMHNLRMIQVIAKDLHARLPEERLTCTTSVILS